MPADRPQPNERDRRLKGQIRARARRTVQARPSGGRFRVPALPTPVDPAVLEGRAREARRLRLMRGRAGTILTGGLGVTSPIPLGSATLLGATGY